MEKGDVCSGRAWSCGWVHDGQVSVGDLESFLFVCFGQKSCSAGVKRHRAPGPFSPRIRRSGKNETLGAFVV